MIDQKLAALAKPAGLPEMPFEGLFGALGALQREVNRIPKELPDGQPLMEQIAAIKTAIEKIPSPEKLDFSDMSTQLGEIKKAVSGLPETIEGQFPALTEQATQELRKAVAELMTKLEQVLLPQITQKMQEVMGLEDMTIPVSSLLRLGKRPKENAQDRDLSHLM